MDRNELIGALVNATKSGKNITPFRYNNQLYVNCLALRDDTLLIMVLDLALNSEPKHSFRFMDARAATTDMLQKILDNVAL